jgi:hypothetical protein
MYGTRKPATESWIPWIDVRNGLAPAMPAAA